MSESHNSSNELQMRGLEKQVSPLITISTFVAILFGAFFWVEARYVKADDFNRVAGQLFQLEKRFDLQIKSDRSDRVQERIWTLEDRAEKNPTDISAKDEIRRLSVEREKLQKEIQVLSLPGNQ